MCIHPAAKVAENGYVGLVQGGKPLEGKSLKGGALETQGRETQGRVQAVHRRRGDARVDPDATCLITLREVAQHNKPSDCWVIIKSKVYNVTDFAKVHPGGSVIYEYAGKDATDVFSAFHSPKAWSMLRNLCMGSVQEVIEETSIVKDFRELKSQMMREGLFRSSKLYYSWKLVSTLSIVVAGVAVLWSAPNSVVAFIVSAALLGLGWQQAGWLCHDFLHNQVFVDRRLNCVMGWFLGPLTQGFSVYWWKSKHNKHHALPNQMTDDYKAVDPDIDTLPYLAWSVEMLDSFQSPNWRWLVKYQQYLFFPLLLFARFTWLEQSITYSFATKDDFRSLLDLAGLALYYSWFLGSAYLALASVWKVVVFAVLSQMIGGLLLGYVFVQSHNGMEVYSEEKDFATAQIISTRDVLSNPWSDWFTGGLNYQIEHHLFPSLPRHNFHKVQPRVKAFCDRHGLNYEACSMNTAVQRVLEHLARIAAQA